MEMFDSGQPLIVETHETEGAGGKFAFRVVPLGFGDESDTREIQLLEFFYGVHFAFAFDPDKMPVGPQFFQNRFGVQLQRSGEYAGGAIFVGDAFGVGVNRFDLNVGGQLVVVAIINIAATGRDFHGTQVLPVRLSREAIMLDNLELNQPSHQNETQNRQEKGDHLQPFLDGLRRGVIGF